MAQLKYPKVEGIANERLVILPWDDYNQINCWAFLIDTFTEVQILKSIKFNWIFCCHSYLLNFLSWKRA